MTVDVIESFISISNYWSFCDVPGLDTSALSLVRAIVCFVCTILAIPLTRKKPLGMVMGALWVFAFAAACEAFVEVISFITWIYTSPNQTPFYTVGWTPQSVSYYVLIDAGSVIAGMLMCMVLGHMPMSSATRVDMKALERVGAVGRLGTLRHRAMLGGLDFFLYAFLVPLLFSALDIWAAIFLVKYSAKPASVFRAPALMVTIISVVEVVVLWAAIRLYGAEYISLINLSAAENGRLLTQRVRRADARTAALANAGVRINIVWGAAAATVFITGALCWGAWLPGQYGLFFQPLIGLAICLILAIVVRLILGIGRIAEKVETSYSTPNFFPGMSGHLMTNARVDDYESML